jgi:hypothetical protein
MLVDDRGEMVIGALSWALHALVSHDREAVRSFLAEPECSPAARVRRAAHRSLKTSTRNP